MQVHLQILQFDPKKQLWAAPQLVVKFLFEATKEIAQIVWKGNITALMTAIFCPAVF